MEISRFTPLDYGVLSAITSRLQPGTPLSESQLHTADASREAHLKFGGFIVRKQREAAGFIWYTQYADYYRPEQVVLFGGILPEFRRRGIASRLLETLERHLLALGVTCLQTQTSENEPTRTFLERRGFSETWRRLPYRLIPTQAQTDELEGLEKRLEAQQIRVITYKSLSGDSECNEKLRALSWLLEQDVPYGEPPTELSLETFVRERLERPEVLKDAFFIALKGKRFIGMSSLWKFDTYLETEFTGVLPEYRGLGVATLLKLMGIRYAQKLNFAELRTTNDASNKAMRKINEHLGFKAQPALLRFEKTL